MLPTQNLSIGFGHALMQMGCSRVGCLLRDSGEDPIVVILSFRSKFYNASVTYSIGKLRKLNLKVNRFINELNLKLYISLIITKNYIALVLDTIYNKKYNACFCKWGVVVLVGS